jgi:hypothetical protein
VAAYLLSLNTLLVLGKNGTLAHNEVAVVVDRSLTQLETVDQGAGPAKRGSSEICSDTFRADSGAYRSLAKTAKQILRWNSIPYFYRVSNLPGSSPGTSCCRPSWSGLPLSSPLATGRDDYVRISRFGIKIFSIAFCMGVVTGVIMPFQIGTNWTRRADMVVVNLLSPRLAYEGLIAFLS